MIEYIVISIKNNEPQGWYSTMNMYKLQEFIRTQWGDEIVQKFLKLFMKSPVKFCFHEYQDHQVWLLKRVDS